MAIRFYYIVNIIPKESSRTSSNDLTLTWHMSMKEKEISWEKEKTKDKTEGKNGKKSVASNNEMETSL